MRTFRKTVTRALALAAAAEALVLGGVASRDPHFVARGDDDTTKTITPDRTPARSEVPQTVKIDQIDPDAILYMQKQLAVRGFYLGPVDGQVRPEMEASLRSFADFYGIERGENGSVLAKTIDQLGAGREVAVRWGSTAPRAPELSGAECWRMNYALAARGYRGTDTVPASIDATTVDALKRFQKDTGHPVQLGNFIARRWLFILGVATPESCPSADGTVPAGMPREGIAPEGTSTGTTTPGKNAGTTTNTKVIEPAVPKTGEQPPAPPRGDYNKGGDTGTTTPDQPRNGTGTTTPEQPRNGTGTKTPEQPKTNK